MDRTWASKYLKDYEVTCTIFGSLLRMGVLAGKGERHTITKKLRNSKMTLTYCFPGAALAMFRSRARWSCRSFLIWFRSATSSSSPLLSFSGLLIPARLSRAIFAKARNSFSFPSYLTNRLDCFFPRFTTRKLSFWGFKWYEIRLFGFSISGDTK